MKYIEHIDISGDAGLKVKGNSPEQLFEYAAKGLFDLVTNPKDINETESKHVEITSDSYEDSLILWLNELIFMFDTYSFIGKSYSIKFHGRSFTASIRGGKFKPEVNERKLLIKAATYHKLSIRQSPSNWEANVIFDI